MTVQQLCDALKNNRLAEVQEVLAAGNVIPVDVFAAALTPDWLKDNIDTIFRLVQNSNTMENALTGNLEINAFLASFQRAYESSHRGRVTRWAGLYSEKNKMASAKGPLTLQLNNIGVKVDDEFLAKFKRSVT